MKSELEEDIFDLISPVHVRTRTLDDDLIEILSSDDEFQVGILSDDVDMDFEDKTLLEECAATDWQDPGIVSHIVYNSKPIVVTQQLKVEQIEVTCQWKFRQLQSCVKLWYHVPSNLDHTPDFDTMPVPTTADSGLWSYNTEPVTGNQHASAPDMLEQFLNNFPANTNGIWLIND